MRKTSERRSPFELNCVANVYDLSVARAAGDLTLVENDGLVYPETFGSSGGGQFLKLLKVMRQFAAECDSVLDVGCGTGAFYEMVRQNGFDQVYQGIDASREHVERARTMYPDAIFSVGDIVSLTFEPNRFSMVLENNVFPFIMEPEQAIREMVRVSSKYVVFRAHATPIAGGVYCYQPLYTPVCREPTATGEPSYYLSDDLNDELRPDRLLPKVMREFDGGQMQMAIAKVKKKFMAADALERVIHSLDVDVIERCQSETTGYGVVMTEGLVQDNSRAHLLEASDDFRISEQDVLIDIQAMDVEYILKKRSA